MKRILCALFLTVFLQSPSLARKTNFSERHSGLLFAVGTYPGSGPEGWDTLSALAPIGTTVSGQDSSYILPLRLGMFWDYRFLSLDVFYKYVTNSRNTWNSKGGVEGSGTTAFKSSGYGSSITLYALQSDKMRLGFVGQYEFINHKVSHAFSLTNEPTQKLTLTNTASTFGGGLHASYWLGDLWVLNFNALYNYGTESEWKIARPDLFFNTDWEKGSLLSPKTGKAAKASFSGIFVELGLKLNFFSL